MKISTGSGDRGMTSLLSGERVSKNHIRIETNGDVDELNSFLGAIAALSEQHPEIVHFIRQIQSNLMIIGASLAITPESSFATYLDSISEQSIRALESKIARMEKELPELKSFILPGGHITAAWVHLARSVCRRTERRVVTLLEKLVSDSAKEQLRNIIVYLNRLSDFLFILARYFNRTMKVSEVLWP